MIKKLLLIFLLLIPNVAYMDIFDNNGSTAHNDEVDAISTQKSMDAINKSLEKKENQDIKNRTNIQVTEQQKIDAQKGSNSEQQVENSGQVNDLMNSSDEKVVNLTGDTTSEPTIKTSDSTSSSSSSGQGKTDVKSAVSNTQDKYKKSQSAADSYQKAANDAKKAADETLGLTADEKTMYDAQKKIMEEMGANTDNDTYKGLQGEVEKAEAKLAKKVEMEKKASDAQATANLMNEKAKKAKKAANAEREAACAKSKDCIDKATFMINVNDISPGMDVNSSNSTNQNVNKALGTIIQSLMIALGSFALLVMTVGAGYIVLHSGQDELLSKGKSIFLSGVYALLVALSAYYLVSIVRFILFQ